MRSSRWLAVLLLLSMSPSWAQSPSSGKSFDQLPASARQLISVKVTGSKRYSDDAVIAASGLQIGTTVDGRRFQESRAPPGRSRRLHRHRLHLLVLLRRDQARAAGHRCRQVRAGALRRFRLVFRPGTSAAHQGARSDVQWRAAAFRQSRRPGFRRIAGPAGGKCHTRATSSTSARARPMAQSIPSSTAFQTF